MPEKKQLGNILVQAGIITVKTLERALERQKGSGRRLGMVLEEMGVITEEELIKALAEQFGFKTVGHFAEHTFHWDVLGLVPENLAVQKLVFPLKQKDGMLALAITDPFDNETIDFLSQKSGMKIFPVLATRQDITDAISKHYLGGKALRSDKQKILVVDDSQAIATMIQTALQKEGYEVIVAHDGIEGLENGHHPSAGPHHQRHGDAPHGRLRPEKRACRQPFNCLDSDDTPHFQGKRRRRAEGARSRFSRFHPQAGPDHPGGIAGKKGFRTHQEAAEINRLRGPRSDAILVPSESSAFSSSISRKLHDIPGNQRPGEVCKDVGEPCMPCSGQ